MKEEIDNINKFYSILKNKFPDSHITQERKEELSNLINKYGYLPYPYIKALYDISEAEVLFCLEKKLENEGTFVEGQITNCEISPLSRNDINNADWIKREAHDIKLINLSGLGNRNNNQKSVSFFDWLKQIIILPTGNKLNNIFNTTIYLTPFHPRGFGCAYIPQSLGVSSFLEDKALAKDTGLNAEEQVKMFILTAQLAGHPVIYDILPQTGRFSKTVLANPYCVRWIDVKSLINKISSELDNLWNVPSNNILSDKILNNYSQEQIKTAIDVYKKYLKGERKFAINEQIKEIIFNIDNDINLRKFKQKLSNLMQRKENQILLQNRVKKIVSLFAENKTSSLSEEDIADRESIELELIKHGLWSLPGGAWNSAGVPVFDKMAKNALYPVMRHYNYKGEDVTKFANLDCQSPYYFVCLESGEYNNDVIEFFVDNVKKLVTKFNFDGIRIDHVNHVIDELSVKDGIPISYRIPEKVISILNTELKTLSPHFAIMAEYMLNQDFVKEYHQNMSFDILYGNDSIFQCYKTPDVIDTDNAYIKEYNKNLSTGIPHISVLKCYNNQDGEYKHINMYPAQLGMEGALFKWFKYKFMPGGYYAQRPIMYIDGDESFSIGGMEETICNEVFMKRNNSIDFYARFDAIDRFAKNNSIVCYGEAHILNIEKDGFVYWQLQTDDSDNFIIVAANYHSPKEYFPKENNFADLKCELGKEINDKIIKLFDNYKFISEYKFNGTDYVEEELLNPDSSMYFERILPAEFRFFKVIKTSNND